MGSCSCTSRVAPSHSGISLFSSTYRRFFPATVSTNAGSDQHWLASTGIEYLLIFPTVFPFSWTQSLSGHKPVALTCCCLLVSCCSGQHGRHRAMTPATSSKTATTRHATRPWCSCLCRQQLNSCSHRGQLRWCGVHPHNPNRQPQELCDFQCYG
jgi:hypothetical protein